MYYALYNTDRNNYSSVGINSTNLKQLKETLIEHLETQLGFPISANEAESDVYTIASNYGYIVENNTYEFEEFEELDFEDYD